MSATVSIRFFGVRGSTPCDDPDMARYGGNTACVVVEPSGSEPIVLDLGTGLRVYGDEIVAAGRADGWRGHVLLSHLHWDHVQGLPFFVPLHHAGSEIDVHGPVHAEGPLGDVFDRFMGPPYFPVTVHDLAGRIRFHDRSPGTFTLGPARVTAASVRHTGPTLGFRIEVEGVAIAYIPDHGPGCSPGDPDDFVPQEVLDLCADVDLLIHDAQHTADEYERKRHWGHSAVEYAVLVATRSGARRLALFHHCPSHDDAALDALLAAAIAQGAGQGATTEILGAHEGLRLDLVGAPEGASR
ncbi:MAG: MBL fold metallo-hydrolase [Actinomycetes bacterium]